MYYACSCSYTSQGPTASFPPLALFSLAARSSLLECSSIHPSSKPQSADRQTHTQSITTNVLD
eukprot:3729079-Rhodomonas_salina.1